MTSARIAVSEMRVAIAAGIAAFGVRVVVLFALPQVPVTNDAALYDRVARQLAGLVPGPPTGGFYRGFGYPIFLGGLYSVTTSYLVVRIVQALLWAVAIGLAVAIAERLFGRRVAIVAAVLALAQVVALPHFLFLLTENLLVLELLGAIAILVFVQPVRPELAAVAYGALLGTIALTHPGWQLFPLFGLPLLWSRRLVVRGVAACLVVVLGVLVPLHWAHPGQPWKTGQGNRGYGGGTAWTFYVGTRSDTGGRPTPADYEAADQGLHSDSYYWREGLENIAEAPGESLALWLGKQWRLWGTREEGEPSTPSASFDRAIANAGTLVNSLTFAWALIGLAALALARNFRSAVILGVPALYAALFIPTFSSPEARYVFAPQVLLVVPAALVLTRLGGLVERGRGTSQA